MGRNFHCQDAGRPLRGPLRLNLKWEMGGAAEMPPPPQTFLPRGSLCQLLTTGLGTGVPFHLPTQPLSGGVNKILRWKMML